MYLHLHPQKDFYPRPPRGGRRQDLQRGGKGRQISIHALREEGDVGVPQHVGMQGISIHALREEGDDTPEQLARYKEISIHALREEGDRAGRAELRPQHYFYPRPPRGGRLSGRPSTGHSSGFLSTPSARRATPARSGGRQASSISIHALREEGDAFALHHARPHIPFLSTPSARRATLLQRRGGVRRMDFYPRPPRGGRRFKRRQDVKLTIFLSTPSARRATSSTNTTALSKKNFYPRPPRGGRPPDLGGGIKDFTISIHALREEGDVVSLSQVTIK